MNICFIKENSNPIGSSNKLHIKEIECIEYSPDKLCLHFNKAAYEIAKAYLKPDDNDINDQNYTININSYYTELYEGKILNGYLIMNALYPFFEIHL